MNVNKININQTEPTYYIASDIYDVTARNNSATFESLSALLSAENLSTLIPTSVRCGGMSIRFVQSSDNKYVQYRLAAPNWSNNIHDWTSEDPYFVDKIMQEVNEAINEHTPIEIHGNVTNAPDEEDLTSVNVGGTDVLKFKDKAYDPLTYSGMGRKILRKNMVNGVNTLTQSMMQATNTIYVIQYDFTLDEDITIPDNCVLEFDGGSISGEYVLTGTNTHIIAEDIHIFTSGILITGTWLCPKITSLWFADITNTNRIKQLINLCSDTIWNDLFIEDGIYSVSVFQEKESPLIFKSKTNIYLNGTITLEGCSLKEYYIIHLKNDNINIVGGTIIGDKITHTGSTGQSGHGIYLDGCRNINILNVNIYNCWGDCIDVTSEDRYNNICKNVVINGCNLHDSRRQGISISHVEDIEIINCYIHDILGSSPQSCIDIEPNDDMRVTNAFIKNCIFSNNNERAVVIQMYSSIRTIENIIISNNIFEQSIRHIQVYCESNAYASNMKNIKITNNVFKNCTNNQQFAFISLKDLYFEDNILLPGQNDNTNNIIDLSHTIPEGNYIFSGNIVNVKGYISTNNFTIINKNVLNCRRLTVYGIFTNNKVNAEDIVIYSTIDNCKLSVINEINLNNNSKITNSQIDINKNSNTVHSDGIVLRDYASVFDCIIEIENVTRPMLVRTTFGRIERNKITISTNSPTYAIFSHDYLTLVVVKDNEFNGTTISGFIDQSSKIIGEAINKKYGDTSVRQALTDIRVGDTFFDTSLGTNGKPIYYAGNNTWVYADGTTVS